MTRSVIWWGATAVLALGCLTPASARPQYLQAFKAHYNTAQDKPMLNAAPCVVCHIGRPPEKNWNVYGQAFRRQLEGATNVQDREKIVSALQAIEGQTNPATKQTFGVMIRGDKLPGSTVSAAQPGQPSTGGPIQPNWVPLFIGNSLEGWHKMNQGNWVVENGLLKYTGGGNGWLRSDKQYTNYSMVVIWRYPQPGNNDSGIFLKAPMEGNPWPGGPQLNMGPGDNLGSIGGTQGTRARPDLIRQNDWNVYQVTVQDGAATLAINGTVAWDMATGLPTGPGYIGIQGEGRPLEIAAIWINPIP